MLYKRRENKREVSCGLKGHYSIKRNRCFSQQIGGTYADPVILPPQVAIGALGKAQVIISV